MEKDIKYQLGPEEEKFLDEVSAVFEPQRERFLIREAVRKKIAATDFSLLEFKRHGTLLTWKYLFVVLSIIGLSVGSWYVFGPEDEAATGAGQTAFVPAAGHSAAENSSPTDAYIDRTTANPSANDLVNLDGKATGNRETTAEKTVGQASAGQERKLKVMTRKLPFNRVVKSEKTEHSTSMNLPEGMALATVKQKLDAIYDKLGMKYRDMSDDANELNLQSLPVKGFYSRIDSKPVEFYIEFRLSADNPSKLLIKLVFSYTGGSDALNSGNDADMESIFYDKLKRELMIMFT